MFPRREVFVIEGSSPVLTLEPFIAAIREGLEEMGWVLSGLQKTTSHQFEGRWEGDSSRSAYLFFHHGDVPEWASVDVFLDETSKGLTGNLALVVDGRPLGALGDVPACMQTLGRLAAAALPEGFRTPVTLRLRLDDARDAAGDAEAEIRFKLRIPRTALDAGAPAVSALCRATVSAFRALLADPALEPYREE